LYPGKPIIVQEKLVGREVSVFAFVDGEHVSEEVAACDYKRLGDNNTGPNTGGMGAYTPPKFWTRQLAEYVRQWIFLPIVREMQRRGTPYRGILYAGLMILPDGTVKVLEFNCRLGDPEAQVILPRFKGDLIAVTASCAKGWLPANAVAWRKNMAVCGVVLASEGYPGHERTGRVVSGIEEAEHAGCLVFHGATTETTEGIVSTAGRPLTIVGIGASLENARKQAYGGCSRVTLKGGHTRSDIAELT
ncbi:MAG: phosphoribosylglycinamide synthetase C domain-containing protein, partial [Candidatus Wildermuthbacteria bacterium]|nr:phosphoribosylglycinamide synthetase C domain-containing protein [Candidatus Wildermuthbacteria bacterium]